VDETLRVGFEVFGMWTQCIDLAAIIVADKQPMTMAFNLDGLAGRDDSVQYPIEVHA
jgi:hypothetical protein